MSAQAYDQEEAVFAESIKELGGDVVARPSKDQDINQHWDIAVTLPGNPYMQSPRRVDVKGEKYHTQNNDTTKGKTVWWEWVAVIRKDESYSAAVVKTRAERIGWAIPNGLNRIIAQRLGDYYYCIEVAHAYEAITQKLRTPPNPFAAWDGAWNKLPYAQYSRYQRDDLCTAIPRADFMQLAQFTIKAKQKKETNQ